MQVRSNPVTFPQGTREREQLMRRKTRGVIIPGGGGDVNLGWEGCSQNDSETVLAQALLLWITVGRQGVARWLS